MLDELNSAQRDKEKLLEREIMAQKGSTATPEQIEEFKEVCFRNWDIKLAIAKLSSQVFQHFDKDNCHALNALQFKSCLQGLGEDPTVGQLSCFSRLCGGLHLF